MSRMLAPALLLVLSASLAAGPPASAPGRCGGVHIVVRGDTLYSIARRCRSTVVAIAQASRLADPRRIEVGQRLVIPGRAAAPEPGKEEPAGDEALAYNFRPGDTLFSLARWARVGVGALIAANPGIDPHKIEIGDNVRLPAGAVPPEAARRRERGTGPGPAFSPPPPAARAQESRPAPAPTPPPVRVHEDHPRPAPAPPPRSKPDEEERQPEGM
jgi:LysM repeat protein